MSLKEKFDFPLFFVFLWRKRLIFLRLFNAFGDEVKFCFACSSSYIACSFYTFGKINHRFLTYICFGNSGTGSQNEFSCVHVIPPNIINLLKSSPLEYEMKRKIFLKANITITIENK